MDNVDSHEHKLASTASHPAKHDVSNDKLIAKNGAIEYQNRTYDDLSSEFKRLYPAGVRALQLIPLMYNRLTLVEKLSHKTAILKIRNDHKHLPGFSQRNIRKNLPSNNPYTPRRVRPQWPKSSDNEVNRASKLSNVVYTVDKNPNLSPTHDDALADSNNTTFVTRSSQQQVLEDRSRQDITECSNCMELWSENCELSIALEEAENGFLEFEFYLYLADVQSYLEDFDPSVEDEEPKVWLSGKINKKTGRLIEAEFGRLDWQQNEIEDIEEI